MIEKDDVKHLAELSRLDFSDKEISSFKNDLDSILSYVDQIKEISASCMRAPPEAEKQINGQPSFMATLAAWVNF